jgi:hypothetical protein
MARILTAKEICERALRAIGAFPLSESAPDGEQMREALFWLDLIMAEVGGTARLFHLIPEGVGLKLKAGQSKYPLKASLAADYPIDGIQFPVDAHLRTPGGRRRPLMIVTRQTWETVDQLDAPGIPRLVYIDRQSLPTLWTYPSLPAGVAGEFVIELDVQRYTPNVAPGGVTGQAPQGSVLHGFGEAWQRFLIERLSQDLASGPIIKLPEQSIARFESQAMKAYAALMRFQNQEHDTEDPIVRGYDDIGPFYEVSGAGGTTTPPDTIPGGGTTDPGTPSPEFYVLDDDGEVLLDDAGNPIELE